MMFRVNEVSESIQIERELVDTKLSRMEDSD
jgi:hypothetical protein